MNIGPSTLIYGGVLFVSYISLLILDDFSSFGNTTYFYVSPMAIVTRIELKVGLLRAYIHVYAIRVSSDAYTS